MRLIRHPVDELHRVSKADGGEGPAREEPIEVATSIAEAVAATVEAEPEDERGVDGLIDRFVRHFGSPTRRLLETERKGAERAGIRVNVEQPVSRIGPRHEELPACGQQAIREPPGVDFGPE